MYENPYFNLWDKKLIVGLKKMTEKITLASDQKVLSKVETCCQDFANKTGITEETVDSILIALTELVNNAIIHGNKNDPKKNITIELNKQDDTFTIKVMDEGQGFDEKSISDPTSEENLYKTSGRGVFIVKHISKSFKHYMEDNHHVAELEFDLTSENLSL